HPRRARRALLCGALLGGALLSGALGGCHLLSPQEEGGAPGAVAGGAPGAVAGGAPGAVAGGAPGAVAGGVPGAAESGARGGAEGGARGGAEGGASGAALAPKGEAPAAPLAARVNGVEITLARLQGEFERRARSFLLKGATIPPNTERTYKTAALNYLIDEQLIAQELNVRDVHLTPEERDAAITAYKGRFRDEVNFQRSLEQSRQSEEEVLAQVLAEARLAKHLSALATEEVSEQELQELYDSLRDARYTTPTRVQVRHILLPLPLSAPPKVAQQRLAEAKRLAREVTRKGADFAALALARSGDAATRDRGGDLGLIERRGDPKVSDSFEAAASALQLHALSEPVRTPLGWHIIKLTDRQPAQLKASHALLKGPDAAARAEELLRRSYDEPFEALAKELSLDEPSRVRGGDLGFLHPQSPHRLGESFKEELFRMKVGESRAFSTPLGAHVALITGVRPERLRASHILIALPPKPTKAQEEAARLEALSALAELREGATQGGGASLFARVARKRSMDEPSKQRGGDVGNFYVGGQPTFSREFEAAAFALKLNEVSAPARSPFGWHVLQVTARAEGAVRPFADARPELIEQLKEKQIRRARAVLMQGLRERAQIERLSPTE
ncbi:MAG: hypothetical protein FJ138_08635, partial [Deltaproteobacteria bacterium]|nr:hypothetical protein [Deltaproteobacteria bacterium]